MSLDAEMRIEVAKWKCVEAENLRVYHRIGKLLTDGIRHSARVGDSIALELFENLTKEVTCINPQNPLSFSLAQRLKLLGESQDLLTELKSLTNLE